VCVNDAVHDLLADRPLVDTPADLVQVAAALFAGERDFIANAANLSALIFHNVPRLNWCGFYLERGGELKVGPFQGKIACVRIPLGKGVCGTSAQEQRTIVVPDVGSFPGHIACDGDSRSEIVVPLLRAGRLIGVLDIDSPVLDRFGSRDAVAFERLAELLLDASDDPR
jgi:L-methionine (R)-S-oxide reductase